MANDTDSLSNIHQIWNCEHAFEFECPMKWEALEETSDSSVRHCVKCDQNVTLCATPEEFVELGNAGRCVAVPGELNPNKLNTMMLGRPSQEAIGQLNEQKRQCEQWWHEVRSRRPSFSPNAMKEIRLASKQYRRQNRKTDGSS